MVVIALMAIMVIGIACSKSNPTNSGSGTGIAITKDASRVLFNDRSFANPTNPMSGAAVIIGAFAIMSDVDRIVSQFVLRDPNSDRQIEQNFKNMNLFKMNYLPYGQLGYMINPNNGSSNGKFLFTLDPPLIIGLKLKAHEWVVIYIVGEIKNALIKDIQMSAMEFYSVTAAVCGKTESSSLIDPPVEYVSPLALQDIYLIKK